MRYSGDHSSIQHKTWCLYLSGHVNHLYRFLVGLIGNILGSVDPIVLKGGAIVEYCVNYVTLTIDLTHDIYPWLFNEEYWNYRISEIASVIDVKRRGSKSFGYWADYVTLLFGHLHDLGLAIAWLNLKQLNLRDRRVDWNGTKGMSIEQYWPWPGLLGYLVEWVGVRDTNRGDSARRLAIDTSRFSFATYLCIRLKCHV